MRIEANKAAQSSAVSYPLLKIKAIEMPINVMMEVMASLLWCQASAFSEELFVSLLLLRTILKDISFHKMIHRRTINVQDSGTL
jgi:hypothetical protein